MNFKKRLYNRPRSKNEYLRKRRYKAQFCNDIEKYIDQNEIMANRHDWKD